MFAFRSNEFRQTIGIGRWFVLNYFFNCTFMMVCRPLIAAVRRIGLCSNCSPINGYLRRIRIILCNRPYRPGRSFRVTFFPMLGRFNWISNQIKDVQIANAFNPSFVRGSVECTRFENRIGMVFMEIRIVPQARVCSVRTNVIPPFPACLSKLSPTMVFRCAEDERIMGRFILRRLFIFFNGRRRSPKRAAFANYFNCVVHFFRGLRATIAIFSRFR